VSDTTTGRGHLIAGAWHPGAGESFASTDPATGEPAWTGRAATAGEVGTAVAAAREAFEGWWAEPVERRVGVLEAFAAQLQSRRDELAKTISLETGKPRWEARQEVEAMAGKVPLSIAALRERRADQAGEFAGATAATRYKPHGALAVFGPFNFPGHLPNGHVVPALLAGNTVVFKPSEMTPAVAERTAELWQSAGLPPGVLNVVHGGRETGAALAAHPGIDGLLFTGSVAVGTALHRAMADHPEKVLALEMGGNNPLVVWSAADLAAAAYHTVQSAYLTAGQRCSCARRLILPAGAEGDRFLERLVAVTRSTVVGPPTAEPEPFMGPVISDAAADRLLAAQADLVARGGVPLLEMRTIGPRRAMLSSGLIDVTAVSDRPDAEHFGPLLQVIRVPDFDAAVAEANATRFGLAAGLLSDDPALWATFYRRARAGVVNWNRPTTGATGRLPFGGTGLSGNGRPSGYFAADYCSYPVASLEIPRLSLPAQRTPGVTV